MRYLNPNIIDQVINFNFIRYKFLLYKNKLEIYYKDDPTSSTFFQYKLNIFIFYLYLKHSSIFLNEKK